MKKTTTKEVIITGLVTPKHGWKRPKGTVNTLPSKTIAGETYTLRELLTKHTKGYYPEGIERTGIYAENPDFDSLDYQQLQNEDIFVKHELKSEVKKQIANTIDEVNKKAMANKKAAETSPDIVERSEAKEGNVSDAK